MCNANLRAGSMAKEKKRVATANSILSKNIKVINTPRAKGMKEV